MMLARCLDMNHMIILVCQYDPVILTIKQPLVSTVGLQKVNIYNPPKCHPEHSHGDQTYVVKMPTPR